MKAMEHKDVIFADIYVCWYCINTSSEIRYCGGVLSNLDEKLHIFYFRIYKLRPGLSVNFWHH